MNPTLSAVLGHAALAGVLLGILAVGGWPPARLATTPWWLPFWIAQAGLFAGTMAWVGLTRRRDDAETTIAEGRRTDLAETRALVVEQLRHLEVERDKLDDATYAEERAALLEIGAAAARALDEATAAPALPDEDPMSDAPMLDRLRALRDADPTAFDAAVGDLGVRPPPPGGLPDLWKGVVWTLLVVGVLGAIGWNVAGDARDRTGAMPMTGGDQVMGDAASPAADPTLAALQERLAADPSDLAGQNQLTELALARQRMDLAMAANESALAIDPSDRDARTFQAVLQAFVGKVDEALAALDALLVEDPEHLRALVYRGLLSIERDPTKAVEVLEKAAALDDNPMLRQALSEARRASAGPSAATLPPGAPTAAEASPIASGSLALEGPAPNGGVLFLSIRDPRGGPPLAAQRLPASPLPSTFEITTADRLPMGGDRPLPGHVQLVVRLDSDGDPLTKPPSDPAAEALVEVGTADIPLTLRARP